MLKPSHRESFEAALTSSLRATRANRSVTPVKDKVETTLDTFGHLYANTLVQSDLFTASSRMWRGMSHWDSKRFVKTFGLWVTKLRQDCLQRQKLALLTREKDCSSWRTPAGSDGEGGIMEYMEGKTGHYKLRYQVNWMSPRACDHKGFQNQGKGGLNLMNQVNWPTPTVAEADKIGNNANYGQVALGNHPAIRGIVSRNKKSKGDGQPDQDKSSTNGKSRGQLNPDWVSQLMGLNPEWTDLGSWATVSY
jgi:hypothetical protein